MKVLVAQTILATPHTETELELGLLHSLAGDNVSYFPLYKNLDSQFLRTTINGDPTIGSSTKEWEIYLKGIIKLFAGELDTTNSLDDVERASQHQQYLVDYVDRFISENPSLFRGEYCEFKRLHVISDALRAFSYMLKAIETFSPDLVYTFNGRFPLSFAVWRAALYKGVECRFHERGFSIQKYECFPTPVGYVSGFNRLLSQWSTGRDVTSARLSAAFYFTELREGRFSNFATFKAGSGCVFPEGFPFELGTYAVYFCSTEGEISMPDSDLFFERENQLATVKRLISCCESAGIPLVIKCHPNSVDNSDQFMNLQSDHVYCISPSIDMCALVLGKGASHRFSIGSSVTYQLIFEGYQCAFLAKAPGYRRQGLLFLNNREGILSYLSSHQDSKLQIPDFIIEWGDFCANFGEFYRFYKPTDSHRGIFDVFPVSPLQSR